MDRQGVPGGRCRRRVRPHRNRQGVLRPLYRIHGLGLGRIPALCAAVAQRKPGGLQDPAPETHDVQARAASGHDRRGYRLRDRRPDAPRRQGGWSPGCRDQRQRSPVQQRKAFERGRGACRSDRMPPVQLHGHERDRGPDLRPRLRDRINLPRGRQGGRVRRDLPGPETGSAPVGPGNVHDGPVRPREQPAPRHRAGAQAGHRAQGHCTVRGGQSGARNRGIRGP